MCEGNAGAAFSSFVQPTDGTNDALVVGHEPLSAMPPGTLIDAAASGGGWGYGWSGTSLPADMDQIGVMRARSPQGARVASEALRAMGQETEAILLASL